MLSRQIEQALTETTLSHPNIEGLLLPLPHPGSLEEHRARLTPPVKEFLRLMATEPPEFETLAEVQRKYPLNFITPKIPRTPAQKKEREVELMTLFVEGITFGLMMTDAGRDMLQELKRRGVEIVVFTFQFARESVMENLASNRLLDRIICQDMDIDNLNEMRELLEEIAHARERNKGDTVLLEKGGACMKFCVANGVPSISTSLNFLLDMDVFPEIPKFLMRMLGRMRIGDHVGINGPEYSEDSLDVRLGIENITDATR